MPLESSPLINDRLIEHVTEYLQTLDPAYFPFSAGFSDEQRDAFVRDLRIGLSDLTDSGSKRGTSSTGYITSDKRLRHIVQEWAAANGGWPLGQNPRNPLGVASVAPIEPV
jgi:hypothetical protein